MTALQKMKLKADIYTILQDKGFNPWGSGSAEIVLFTDKKVNEKSKKTGNQYVTSFGVKGAEKFILENRNKEVI